MTHEKIYEHVHVQGLTVHTCPFHCGQSPEWSKCSPQRPELAHSLPVSRLLLHELHLNATYMCTRMYMYKMHRAGTGVPTYIVHVCVHAHIHVHEKSQGGVRQASGPSTGILSFVTLPARETWPKHHIHVCTCTRFMYSTSIYR